MSNAWQGEWDKRIYVQIRGLGYDSVRDLARAHPSVTLSELVHLLGNDVVVVQLETLLRDEALSAHQFSEHARDILARRLLQFLPSGWGVGADAGFRGSRAFASWLSMLGDEFESKGNAVWDALLAAMPREGWKPCGGEDPLLVEIFGRVGFPDGIVRVVQDS